MKIILKQNELDDAMIELRDKNNKLLYAVFHSDLIYEDKTMRELVKAGGTVTCELQLVHSYEN